MSTKSQIHTELNRLASLSPTGPHSLRLDIGDGRLEATLSQIDQLACSFEHFSYKTDKLANAAIDELKEAGYQPVLVDQKTSIRMRRKDGQHLANEKALLLHLKDFVVLERPGQLKCVPVDE